MMTILRNPAWTSFTWLGMTAGVSLLATPLRFGAETISRAVALDVGRVVFNGLNKAEFVLLVIVLVQLRVSGHTRALWMPAFALALILIVQASWLLPELSARTDIVIAGGDRKAGDTDIVRRNHCRQYICLGTVLIIAGAACKDDRGHLIQIVNNDLKALT